LWDALPWMNCWNSRAGDLPCPGATPSLHTSPQAAGAARRIKAGSRKSRARRLKTALLIFPQRSSPAPSRCERIARLVFDSLMPPQLADVRAESPTAGAAGRQMLYRVEGYDIDLRFEQTEDGEAEELIGQILPEDRPPAEMPAFTVRLRRDEVETGRAQTDARGIFKFARIPSGVYDLRIEAHGVEIHIPQTSSARAS
jgi:hypothetical protein